MTSSLANITKQLDSAFLGLAPFLRMNLANVDLLSIGQQIKEMIEVDPENAILWMNLSTVMLCLGQREIGLAIQSQALELKRVYHLSAIQQPTKFRLLMLMAPGDLSGNTPLDCLLENSDVDLIYYYVSASDLMADPIPAHDALMVAISESDENFSLLTSLQARLAGWSKPVINSPKKIMVAERSMTSAVLQNAPGLIIPNTHRVSRSQLFDIANGKVLLSSIFSDCHFPIILRPVGSHAGRDLNKVDVREEIFAYLSKVESQWLFLANFVDYSGRDGLFRKFRIALLGGVPFVCHMAVSSHWMIHYVNAGMYEDERKRGEEAAFMENFAVFAQKHQLAFKAIYQRTELDYLCIDCAETVDGQLLIFEIDHAMIVHAMDPVALFPYKPLHMEKLKTAFRDYLFRLNGKLQLS